jgi:peptidoglycan/xylan/chitin deacetylase (PgdA/CDA1 family)
MDPWLIAAPAAATLGSAVIAFGAVYPRSQMFGATVCHTASRSQLAITFDDGPNPAITPKLLDLLERYEAKATFFVIGRFVRECGGLTREVADRGHLLANHTQTHPNLFWLRPTVVRQELERCQDALHQATGDIAKYFRPPYGFRNPWVISTARELGMQTVMWTLIPGDWKARSGGWLAARMRPVAQRAEGSTRQSNGDVLCLHDGAHRALGGDRTCTLEALEYWLPRWRDLGLKFVTISEAVSLPAR